MSRVMLDTNIYGLIVKEDNVGDFISRVSGSEAIVCGSTIIGKNFGILLKRLLLGKGNSEAFCFLLTMNWLMIRGIMKLPR